MKRITLMIALALVGSALVALAPAASSAGTLRLMAVGDTSTTSAAQKNVDAAVAEGAQGFVGLGDYNYDSSVSTWKRMFAPLTSKAAYMAIGNHDDRHQFAELMPDGTRWSKSVNGVRIVALNGMSSVDTARLRSDLCHAPEATRIVIVHHNWWLLSAAHHPGSEFPTSASTMDAIMKDCGVDLILAGHEHNYQRMVRNGIDYVIAGTGGRGLYPIAGVPSGTVVTYAGYGRVVLDLSPDGFSATFKTLDGTVKDTFSSGSAAPSPSPTPTPAPSPSGAPTFTAKGGNGWWAQVAVSGSPTKVEARDTGASYVALAKKSWGDWAGSFRIESGHDVQYRATFADGHTYESCWFDHPGTTCASGATPTAPPTTGTSGFTATYRNVRGNAYWVEADVSVTGGTLDHVEARVNGASWVPLDHKSWGSWAKSLRAPNGSTVEFRSVATGGQTSTPFATSWPPAA